MYRIRDVNQFPQTNYVFYLEGTYAYCLREQHMHVLIVLMAWFRRCW